MALDYVVRDPRGIAGMQFFVDGGVYTFTEVFTHLRFSCGFTSGEAAGYLRVLLDDEASRQLLPFDPLQGMYAQAARGFENGEAGPSEEDLLDGPGYDPQFDGGYDRSIVPYPVADKDWKACNPGFIKERLSAGLRNDSEKIIADPIPEAECVRHLWSLYEAHPNGDTHMALWDAYIEWRAKQTEDDDEVVF